MSKIMFVVCANSNYTSFKQHFQLRSRRYQTGYLCTSRNNALCAMMPVCLALLVKLVMTPCRLYFHSRCFAKSLLSNFISDFYLLMRKFVYHDCRRTKLRNVVCVGRSSISNALGKFVLALVVKLPAQAGRLPR
jgi:hypothetical protein